MKKKIDCSYVVDTILSEGTYEEKLAKIHAHLEVVGKRLQDRMVPLDQLAITKQLTKNPEDYPNKNSLAHVSVALRHNKNPDSKKLKADDTVSFIICQVYIFKLFFCLRKYEFIFDMFHYFIPSISCFFFIIIAIELKLNMNYLRISHMVIGIHSFCINCFSSH